MFIRRCSVLNFGQINAKHTHTFGFHHSVCFNGDFGVLRQKKVMEMATSENKISKSKNLKHKKIFFRCFLNQAKNKVFLQNGR